MTSYEKKADVGASPYPTSGEIMVQGQIEPPARHTVAGNPGTQPTVDDYVVYNRCPVFTTETEAGPMTHSKRHRMGAKHRRLGNVPKIWSNFFGRGKGATGDMGHYDADKIEKIRFVGVAVDGQHNGKDAHAFPESAGRLAVMVQGAVSMVLDERYLDNPTFGDYLEWYPEDSGLRISGTKKYGLPIIRNRKPSDINAGRDRLNYNQDVNGGNKFTTLDEAKGMYAVYQNCDKKHIIGMYLEHTPGQNEVRVLLRPFTDLKPNAVVAP